MKHAHIDNQFWLESQLRVHQNIRLPGMFGFFVVYLVSIGVIMCRIVR